MRTGTPSWRVASDTGDATASSSTSTAYASPPAELYLDDELIEPLVVVAALGQRVETLCSSFVA